MVLFISYFRDLFIIGVLQSGSSKFIRWLIVHRKSISKMIFIGTLKHYSNSSKWIADIFQKGCIYILIVIWLLFLKLGGTNQKLYLL